MAAVDGKQKDGVVGSLLFSEPKKKIAECSGRFENEVGITVSRTDKYCMDTNGHG